MTRRSERQWRGGAIRWAFGTLAFCVVVMLLVAYWLSEPRIEGESLSDWLDKLGPGTPHWAQATDTPWVQERLATLTNAPKKGVFWFENRMNDTQLANDTSVRTALKEMGRSAVPHLTKRVLISHKPTRLGVLLQRILPQKYAEYFDQNSYRSYLRCNQAYFALAVLSSEAHRAITQFEAAALAEADSRAMQALEFAYPASIASVVNVALNGKMQARHRMLYVLKTWDDDDARILAALQKSFTDAEPSIRQNASYTLGAIAKNSPAAIESIRRGLSDRDPVVRRFNAFSAGLAGRNAVQILPEITVAKNDADRITARFAGYALRMLTTEGLAASPSLKASEPESGSAEK